MPFLAPHRLLFAIALPFALVACSKASRDSRSATSETTAADVASASRYAPRPDLAPLSRDLGTVPGERTVSRKSEWSIGGIVHSKTEIVTSDPEPVAPDPGRPDSRTPRNPQSGLLTAGDTDDLINADQYAAYAGRFLQKSGGSLPFVDTRKRVAVKIVDARGRPVPFAAIDISRAGTPLRLVTAADGQVSFYPGFDKIGGTTRIRVVSHAGQVDRVVDVSRSKVSIAMPGTAGSVSALDLALVIDTTGSMGDEMAYIRTELDSIIARLKRDTGQVDLHIGVVLYRDEGDSYVVRSMGFSGDVGAVRELLSKQDADGGGDMPEAMDQAVAAAARLQWRTDAAKAMVLITDAPPHPDNLGRTLAATGLLRARGVQIVPVAASGVDDTAQYVLRTMAALTQGRYLFLTDDSGVGDSHAEPDVACYVVTRLDQLIARVLSSVVTGRRVEPRDDEVIRAVGSYDSGRCGSPRPVTQN